MTNLRASEALHLTVALRALIRRPGRRPKTGATRKSRKSQKSGTRPRWLRIVVVLDVETTTDPTQRFTFGSYRLYTWDGATLVCVEEGLIYGDDLKTRDPDGFEILKEYSETQLADVVEDEPSKLEFLSRSQFVHEIIWRLVCRRGALLVGFNLPFDLSRLAIDVGEGRDRKAHRFRGGFSFILSRNPHRPRLACKHVDSKRSFMKFERAKSQRRAPGPLLDLRTLAFALTNESYTLAAACEAFRVTHRKQHVHRHGVISKRYIDYNRRDVLATAELLERLRHEFDRHPVPLAPWQAYSPARIAKAYFRAMGITPPQEKFRNVPTWVLGASMLAYYGGRTEAGVRRQIAPVVYLDFLSMYTTVQSLMGLWDFQRAARVEVEKGKRVIADVQQLLATVTLERCLEPGFWRELRGFAKVVPDNDVLVPDNDVLPVRAQYGEAGDETFTIGVNPVSLRSPMWYALPDLVVSVLRTGKVPKIVNAFRLVPRGRQRGLRSTKLLGTIDVDPRDQDFFRTAIEARKRIERDEDLSPEERKRLSSFVKTMANSGAYGVAAERNRETPLVDEREKVTVFGAAGPFAGTTAAFEEPGEYSFPPIAALVTAGARLMLALVERAVRDRGGVYAFCDTDSMAIVATESGEPYQPADGSMPLPTLSWADVDAVIGMFDRLNPYDHASVPGSILKIEEENYRKGTKHREQLYAWVISAKRYALFNIAASGQPLMRKKSEHGLGQLLNPTDPASENNDWIEQVWEMWVREALGLEVAQPTWWSRPAMTRLTVSSPRLYRPFAAQRRTVPYRNRVKPWNFVLSPTVVSTGHAGNAKRFHLIGPYTTDPRGWLRQRWTDIYTGKKYGITTGRLSGGRVVRVKSYGDVLHEYERHPEAKRCGPDGLPCTENTTGVLYLRPVRVGKLVYIGKESNLLEEVEQQTHHDWDDVLDVWEDPREDPWPQVVVPILKHRTATAWAREIGCSPRTIKRLRMRHCRPSPEIRRRLLRAVDRWVTRQLARKRPDPKRVELAQQFHASPIRDEVDRQRPRRMRKRRQAR